MPSNRLFVYGTLKRGGRLHGIMKTLGARFVGLATLPEATLYSVNGHFPALGAPTAPGQQVQGEVYDVSDGALMGLDRVEHAYKRRVSRLTDGTDAYVYWWARDVAHLPHHGEVWECQ